MTALVRVAGQPVGVLANQPQAMAGTLDIAASQKGARFVTFCDSFNLPLLTVVDTPGFMPGRDLEWRGVIRHGAELVFAYAEATVPRICLVVRKAYGGAYIVMDSKGMGNDLCVAWPSAELAVMGAERSGADRSPPGGRGNTGQIGRRVPGEVPQPLHRGRAWLTSTWSSTRPRPVRRWPGAYRLCGPSESAWSHRKHGNSPL